MDDFDRAMVELSKHEESELSKGVELIKNKLNDTLQQKGLSLVEVNKGDDFNADNHEAVTQIPAPTDDLKGKIIDADTKIPLLANFQLSNLESGKIISQMQSKTGNGEFLVTVPNNKDFALYAEKEGYMFYSKNIFMDSLTLSKDGFLIVRSSKIII